MSLGGRRVLCTQREDPRGLVGWEVEWCFANGVGKRCDGRWGYVFPREGEERWTQQARLPKGKGRG